MISFILVAMLGSPAAQPDTADPNEKVVCKRQPVIGSRIKVNKVCMTRSQWNDHQQGLAGMKRDLLSGAGGHQDPNAPGTVIIK